MVFSRPSSSSRLEISLRASRLPQERSSAAIVFGLAVEVFPNCSQCCHGAASRARHLAGAGDAGRAGLNLLFRIGLSARFDDRGSEAPARSRSGSSWTRRRGLGGGATCSAREVQLEQSIEPDLGSGVARGPLTVDASFDEFRPDLRVTYEGTRSAAEKRPRSEEIIGRRTGSAGWPATSAPAGDAGSGDRRGGR